MTGGAPSQNCLLPNDVLFLQNDTRVIPRGADDRASLHPLARAGKVPGIRSGGLLPREGWLLPRGQTDLCRLSCSHRVPELRVAPRRAVRRTGRDERTGTPTPE